MAESDNVNFARKPESVPAARSALEQFAQGLSSVDLYDASLCLSELVTNAVQHPGHGTGDELELEMQLTEVMLRVEVRDPGAGFDPGGSPSQGDERGWGLFIVDQLSSRWGVETGEATLVWFELDRRDDALSEQESADRPEGTPSDSDGRRTEIANAVARLRLGRAITS